MTFRDQQKAERFRGILHLVASAFASVLFVLSVWWLLR
jgi:hypothetical protein